MPWDTPFTSKFLNQTSKEALHNEEPLFSFGHPAGKFTGLVCDQHKGRNQSNPSSSAGQIPSSAS